MKKYFEINMIAALLFLVSISCKGQGLDKKDSNENGDNKVKVGAWYFGGWSFPPENSEGHTFHISPTLITQYKHREPVWGWREDSYQVMVDQVNYAANAGLSFWGICWYENSLVPETKYMDNLNIALDMYLKVPNKNKLDFFLLSCHPVSSENWPKVINRTVSYFKEPNYLKVDGKPVLVFFNADEVITGMGGIEGTKEALTKLREEAKKQGHGEISIGARTRPMPSNPNYQMQYQRAGFDFVTTYQNADDGRKNAGQNPYQNLVEGDKKTWKEISDYTSLPYVPTMGVGYDMRPWGIDHPTLPASDYWYEQAKPEEIANHLRGAMQWTKANKHKVLDNLLFIYAWNENGEGGWLTPTKSEGTKRLDAIKKVIQEVNNQ